MWTRNINYDQSYISNIKIFNCDLTDYCFYHSFQFTLFYKQTFSFCSWLECYILFNTAIECICIGNKEN